MSQNRTRNTKLQKNRKTAGRSRAPLFLALGGALLLVLVGLGLWISRKPATVPESQQAGAPHLEVDRDEINLGDVKLGQTVKVSFTLKNSGNQPLRFSEAPYIEVVEGC